MFYILHVEIRQSPQRVSEIITACGVLHNIAKLFNTPLPKGDEDNDDNVDENNAVHGVAAFHNIDDDHVYRKHIVSTHFM